MGASADINQPSYAATPISYALTAVTSSLVENFTNNCQPKLASSYRRVEERADGDLSGMTI